MQKVGFSTLLIYSYILAKRINLQIYAYKYILMYYYYSGHGRKLVSFGNMLLSLWPN